MYSSKTAKNGRTMYFKNNKLISVKDIPEGELVMDKDLEGTGTVDYREVRPDTVEVVEAPPIPQSDSRDCFICGQTGTTERFIFPRTVYMCQEHYNSLTFGEVVQALREKESNGNQELI